MLHFGLSLANGIRPRICHASKVPSYDLGGRLSIDEYLHALACSESGEHQPYVSSHTQRRPPIQDFDLRPPTHATSTDHMIQIAWWLLDGVGWHPVYPT